MPTMPTMTINEIIRDAGGVSKLAALIGVDHSTVSGWKREGRFPAGRAIIIHERMHIPLADIPWRRIEVA